MIQNNSASSICCVNSRRGTSTTLQRVNNIRLLYCFPLNEIYSLPTWHLTYVFEDRSSSNLIKAIFQTIKIRLQMKLWGCFKCH